MTSYLKTINVFSYNNTNLFIIFYYYFKYQKNTLYFMSFFYNHCTKYFQFKKINIIKKKFKKNNLFFNSFEICKYAKKNVKLNFLFFDCSLSSYFNYSYSNIFKKTKIKKIKIKILDIFFYNFLLLF
jgi:hypothetical protein